MRNTFTLLFILFTKGLVAQRLPSPEASSLIREVNVPVNHYSGLPSLEVPLYSMEHVNGSVMSIGLNYHPYGTKVQSLASSYGLGWNLQGGGMITRIIQDKEDGIFPFVDLNWSEEQQYKRVALIDTLNLTYPADGERDIFYFSFPGGSGRFVVDDNGVAYTIPYQDIKIGRTTNDFATTEWIITDIDGTKYYFGENGMVEKTKRLSMNSDEVYEEPIEPLPTPVSGWFLTRIDFLNTPEDVTFSYVTGEDYTYETYAEGRVITIGVGLPDDETKMSHTRTTIISPKYLDKINVFKGSIDLDYVSGRSDIPNNKGRRLSLVKLKDHTNKVVSKYILNHSYFNANDSYYEGGMYGTCNTPECKRLKLDAILLEGSNRSITYRSFDYMNDDEFHSSGYDKYELPPRNSAYVDHWGFFNGSKAGTGENTMVAKIDYDYPNSPWENDDAGVDKSAHANFTLAGLLRKITFPTGGSVMLNFEANRATSGSDPLGGVRIKSIEYDYNDGQNNRKVEFEYQNVEFFSKPKYSDYFVVEAGPGGQMALVTGSQSLVNLFDINGSPVSNGKVIEKIDGQGQIEYTFHNLQDRPDTPANEFRYTEGSGNQGGTDLFRYPVTTYFWERGNPQSIVTKSEGSLKVAETTYEYHFSNNDIQVFHNVTSRKTGKSIYKGFDGGSTYTTYNVAKYDYISRPFTVKKNTQIRYSDGREDLSSSVVTEFSYHNTYKTLLDERTITYPDGRGTKESIYYPIDLKDKLNAPWQLNNLENRHAIGIPIQTINRSKIDNGAYQVVGGTLKDIIRSTSAQGTHSYQFRRERQLFLSDALTDAAYNSLVNNSTDYDDLHANYEVVKLYDYDPETGLPSKETDKITDVEVDLAYNAQGLLTTETINPGKETEKSFGYTHEPLVGISEITDVNNRSAYFAYDDFERLSMIKDHDQNIVTRYRYNYAGGDLDVISGEISINGYNKTGSVLTFSAVNVSLYGEANYSWSLNGEATKTGSSITHTFNTTGTKTIELTISSPEYENPFVVDVLLIIYDVNFIASVVGTTTYDYCQHVPGTTLTYGIDFTKLGATCYDGVSNPITGEWSFRKGQGSWVPMETSELPEYVLTDPGSYTIQYTATDACDNVYQDGIGLVVTQDCGSGGGGIE